MKKTDDKERKLTKAEQKRMENFDSVKTSFLENGYEMKEHTLGIVYANVIAFFVSFPFMAPVIALFILFHRASIIEIFDYSRIWFFLPAYIIAVVLHEAVHGVTWGLFAKNHFKSINFGLMKEMLTPYCTCSEPLEKRHYILGSLMPLFLIGYLPAVIGVFTSQGWLFLLGIIMILGAGGDIIITYRMLRYKSEKKETVYFDHPVKCGFITFEK